MNSGRAPAKGAEAPGATPRVRASLPQKLLAEAVGTLFLTLVPAAVDIAYFGSNGGIDFASRWLARGFVVAAAIYSFGSISGAHLDPAVSLAFTLRRVFAPAKLVAYVVAQFGGAFAASGLLWLVYGPRIELGASQPDPGVSSLVAFGTEVVLTFVLVVVILATAEQEATIGKQAALAVGFAVSACGFAGGTLSGASMNPARSLAPQLLGGDFSIMWIYVAGPLAGAVLAALIAPMLLGPPQGPEREAAQGE
ncbi:MAG TPA: aquaporin [Candidatus Elarobacter sp.]|nr:aquaporin [Candidatus Elarobacter sp.]